MKNRIAVILMFGFVIIGTSQETQFSFRAGYVNAFGKLTIENVVILESPEDSYFEGNPATEKDNVGGFYAGISADISISDKIYLHPELLYTNVDDQSLLQVPVFLKFAIYDNLSLLAGPQITYTLEKVYSGARKINIGFGLGTSYKISEAVFAQANYTVQLNDYYKSNDITSKLSFLNIGLGYNF